MADNRIRACSSDVKGLEKGRDPVRAAICSVISDAVTDISLY